MADIISEMRIVALLLLPCLCLSGCAVLENLDGVFTLAQYSSDKDAQHRLVKSINANYDALSKAIDQGHIEDYRDEAAFERAFGDPILKKNLSGGVQRWLYRHAIYRLSKDKVYVYFDQTGRLVKWERLPCSKFF